MLSRLPRCIFFTSQFSGVKRSSKLNLWRTSYKVCKKSVTSETRNFTFTGDGTDGKLSKAEGGSDKEKDEDTGIGVLEEMLDNLDQFVVEPSPQGCVVKCRITRDRKGMDRGKETFSLS